MEDDKSTKAAKLERRHKSKEEREGAIKQEREHFRKRERNKQLFNYGILAVVFIALLYAAYVWWDANNTLGQHDALAKCLTAKGVVMHGTDWCPHCQEQKQLFGTSFKFVDYINCDLQPDVCKADGVDGYPTWTFPGGKNATGTQPLDILAERAGCATN